MTGYTVIPATPGTLMVEVVLPKGRGATAEVVDVPVIAWRIPTTCSEDVFAPVAITLGGHDELFNYALSDQSTDDDITEMPHTFVTRGFQIGGADQTVMYRGDPYSRAAFEMFATLELQDRLDDWIADQEQEDRAPIVVDLRSEVPF